MAAAANSLIRALGDGSHIFHTRMYGWATGVALAGLALAGEHPDAEKFLNYGRDFYVDRHMIEDAISREGTFTLVHYATKFNVDVVIPRKRPFDQMQLDRRTASVVSTHPPRQVSVTTAEDAILSKLERHRKDSGTSQRGWRDILGVMQSKAGLLDLSYLRHWAAELGVTDLLERALKEA